MNIVTRTFALFSFFTALLIATPIMAQTPATTDATPIMVAATELYNATLLETNGRQATISFDLFNQVGVQPGVKYSIDLVRTDGGKLLRVHQAVFPEVLDLHEGETVSRTVTYEAPPFAVGEYELWMTVKNEAGLTLAIAPVAGTFELSEALEHVMIDTEGCFLTVVNEGGETYLPFQGVDIRPDEQLTAHCDITSNFPSTITVQPVMRVHERSVFGPLAVEPTTYAAEALTLDPGETKAVSLPLLTSQVPQSYDTVLGFALADSSEIISSEAVFHYVIVGTSGTVKNVVLDKAAYAAGEAAVVTMFFTGSADTFPGSRLGVDSLVAAPTARVVLHGEGGVQCSEAVTQRFSLEEVLQTITVPVTADCLNPTATVSLLDGTTVLDERSLGVISRTAFDAPDIQSQGVSRGALFMILLVLVVLVLWWFTVRPTGGQDLSDKDTAEPVDNVTLRSLLLLALLGSGALFPAAEAEAATFYVGGAEFTVSLSGGYASQYSGTSFVPLYKPGAPVTVTGSASWSSCNNVIGTEEMLLTVFPNHDATDIRTLVSTTDLRSGGIGRTEYNAPQSEGDYFMQAAGSIRALDGSSDPQTSSVRVGYKVQDNQAPTTPEITHLDRAGKYVSGATQYFEIVSTDADGDQIRYTSGVFGTSQSGYQESGVPYAVNVSHIGGGTYTMRARAYDRKEYSAWAEYQFVMCSSEQTYDPITEQCVTDGGEDGGSSGSVGSTYVGADLCGPAHGQIYTGTDVPAEADRCVSGTLVRNYYLSADETRFSWQCYDTTQYGSCSATRVVPGVCGDADGGVYESELHPYYNSTFNDALCRSGQDPLWGSMTWDGTTITWPCAGSGGASGDSCSATYIREFERAACGAATEIAHATTPSSDLCAAGDMINSSVVEPYPYRTNTVSLSLDTYTYHWACRHVTAAGIRTMVECEAPKLEPVLSVCINDVLVAKADSVPTAETAVRVETNRTLAHGLTDRVTVFFDTTPDDCAGTNLATRSGVMRETDFPYNVLNLSARTVNDVYTTSVFGDNRSAVARGENIDVQYGALNRHAAITLKYTVLPENEPVSYGACGVATSQTHASEPAVGDRCAVGESSAVQTLADAYRWECGDAGQIKVACAADRQLATEVFSVCADGVFVGEASSGTWVEVPRSLGHTVRETLTAYFDTTPNDCAGADLIGNSTTVAADDLPEHAVTVTGPYSEVVTGDNPGADAAAEIVRVSDAASGATIDIRYSVPAGGADRLVVCSGSTVVAAAGEEIQLTRDHGHTDTYRVFYDETPDCVGDDVTASVGVTEVPNPDSNAVAVTPGAIVTVQTTNPDPGDRAENVRFSYGGQSATLAYVVTGTPAPLPNLSANVGTVVASPGFDPTTGNHDYIELTNYNVFNDGTADAGASVLTIEVDLGNDGSIDITLPDINVPALSAGDDTGTLGPITLATDVPPGINRVIVTVDADDDVSESDEDDNEILRYGPTGGYPDPGLELRVSPTLVRAGQTAELSWNTHAIYPMNCIVSGPGISTISFDPSVPAGTGNPTGTETTGPISSKSEFILRCTAPDGSVFSDTATVQSVGDIEEI